MSLRNWANNLAKKSAENHSQNNGQKTVKKGQNRPNLAVFGQNRHAKYGIT